MSVGSNETAETLRHLFGVRWPLVVRYVEWLSTAGLERGLIGPAEVDRLWERHIANCAALAPLIPVDQRVIDVGSGAGLPGIVLALARPDLKVLLIEAMSRRTAFLREVVADLGLRDVTVENSRAENVACTAPVVTARAVAPLPRLVKNVAHLLEPGGVLLALKGARVWQEVHAAEHLLAKLGYQPGVEVLTVRAVAGQLTVQRDADASNDRRWATVVRVIKQ